MKAVGHLSEVIEANERHAAEVQELLEADPPETCPACGQVVNR